MTDYVLMTTDELEEIASVLDQLGAETLRTLTEKHKVTELELAAKSIGATGEIDLGNRLFYHTKPEVLDSTDSAGGEGKSKSWEEALKTALEPITAQTPPNLFGSLCSDGKHRLAIDIDLPAQLWETSTPGHFHLIVDYPTDWEPYLKFLEAAAEYGLIQKGYLEASKVRGQTNLRLPWVKKPQKKRLDDDPF
jgi:hypothetical protein